MCFDFICFLVYDPFLFALNWMVNGVALDIELMYENFFSDIFTFDKSLWTNGWEEDHLFM